MTEIFEVTDRPVPRAECWIVDCPSCGQDMAYSPKEGDSGEITMDPAEWPVCECGCMFRPADVALVEVEEKW